MATGLFDGGDLIVPDLRVGEIRALRTFRLSGSGCLRPVAYQGGAPWEDGANTAYCLAHGHSPAAPGCRCGFWAYGTYRSARDHAEARRVLAVVTCWGRVVPGTRGLRAQYARIEAIWLSARVSPRLARRLRQRYPSVTFYRSRRRMLRRHPPTRLESYDPPWAESHERRLRRPRWERRLRWEIGRLRLWWEFDRLRPRRGPATFRRRCGRLVRFGTMKPGDLATVAGEGSGRGEYRQGSAGDRGAADGAGRPGGGRPGAGRPGGAREPAG